LEEWKGGSKMKKFLTEAFLLLIILLYSDACFALLYDFTIPGIATGQATTVYVVDGIPLEIQAGTMDADGNFTLGGSNTVIGQSLGTGGGLGVIEIGQSQVLENRIDLGEGLNFNFNPYFIPKIITFENVGSTDGPDFMRVFTDGNFFGDFDLSDDNDFFTAEVPIPLTGDVSKLGVTAVMGASSNFVPDFYVASIEGHVVPEPATILLLGSGFLGFVGFSRKRSKKMGN
jgi:hypothetical protein